MTRVRADHCTQRLVLGTAIRRRHRTMSAVGHPMAGPNDGTKNRPLRTCDGDIHGGPLTVDPQRRWPRGARRRSADFHRIEPPKLFNSSSENGSPHPRYARHALILSPDRPSRHTGSSRRKGAYILAFGFGCGAGIPVFALGSITNNAGCCVDLRRLGAPEIGYSSRKAGGANGAPQQGPTGERCKDGFGFARPSTKPLDDEQQAGLSPVGVGVRCGRLEHAMLALIMLSGAMVSLPAPWASGVYGLTASSAAGIEGLTKPVPWGPAGQFAMSYFAVSGDPVRFCFCSTFPKRVPAAACRHASPYINEMSYCTAPNCSCDQCTFGSVIDSRSDISLVTRLDQFGCTTLGMISWQSGLKLRSTLEMPLGHAW